MDRMDGMDDLDDMDRMDGMDWGRKSRVAVGCDDAAP